MKRRLVFVLIFSFLIHGQALAADAAPAVSAKAMILYHAPSGRVLAEKNADDILHIASTTKLMTALAAVRRGDLEAEVEIRPEWAGTEGSSMYLTPGETYTLRELLEGMLLTSGNDAALAVAETVSGSQSSFVEEMNRIAGELRLSCTHYANPHGLDEEGHYSTARDLAILMGHVMEEPVLRDILGMTSVRIHDKVYANHNKLLKLCPGVNGGKTGYTRSAGRCLVSSCQRDGLELICVPLSDPEDWRDHEALYDWGFSRYRSFTGADVTLPAVPLITGGEEKTDWEKPFMLCVDRNSTLTREVRLPRFLFTAADPGERAGEILIRENGALLSALPLIWSGIGERETAFLGAIPV